MPFVRGQTLPYMATPKRKILAALQFIQQQRQRPQQQQQRHQMQHHIPQNNSTGHEENSIITRRTTQRQFLDLGSGDGETVYQALQLLRNTKSKSSNHHPNSNNDDDETQYYYTKCIGIELNTTLYLWSCWRRLMFWSRSEQLRSQFVCRDIFQLPSPSSTPTSQNHHFRTTTTTTTTNTTTHPSEIPPSPPSHHHQHWIRQSDTILIFGIPSLMVPLSQLLVQHQCQAGTYILCYRFPLPVATTNCGMDHNGHDPHNDPHTNNNNINSNFDNHSLLCARLVYDQEEMRIYECAQTIVPVKK
jgi:hypothetical protein